MANAIENDYELIKPGQTQNSKDKMLSSANSSILLNDQSKCKIISSLDLDEIE